MYVMAMLSLYDSELSIMNAAYLSMTHPPHIFLYFVMPKMHDAMNHRGTKSE
jgi:hypothetical protein